ncbi:MAG: hypothetical protein IKQ49_03880 [Eubacterium sp.]|nr:hypothetical protein [Eubacterium sp.]
MKTIKKRNALKILYYMMAADGIITDTERSTFDELGRLMDDRYDNYRNDILWECRTIALTTPEGDPVFQLLNSVTKELNNLSDTLTEDTIPGRLLVWNMLAIALCDKDYADSERRIIDEAVRKLELDKEDFLKMERAMKAASAVNREIEFLQEKVAENPDLEPQLRNLKERENLIKKGARDLMVWRG